MTYKVERNNGTGGFCCHFEHNAEKPRRSKDSVL